MTTRFAGVAPWPARAILGAALALAVWALLTTQAKPNWSLGNRAAPDLELYRDIIDGVRAGDDYYELVRRVLRREGMEPRSMFNWRQPTGAFLLAALPDPSPAFWLLVVLAGLSVVAASQTLLPADAGRFTQAAGVILLMGGAFTWSWYEPDLYLSSEPWCEALLLLSLAAYARGRWPLGMLTALAALALRELVLPYCVIAAFVSGWQKRWRELACWGGFLGIYVALLALHGAATARLHTEMQPTDVSTWLKPTGRLQFVILTGSMNFFLRPLPGCLLAFYLPIALVGLAGWKGETGARVALSAGAYVTGYFLLWGGDYWGFLYTPWLVLGLFRAPAALADLWTAVWGTPSGSPLN